MKELCPRCPPLKRCWSFLLLNQQRWSWKWRQSGKYTYLCIYLLGPWHAKLTPSCYYVSVANYYPLFKLAECSILEAYFVYSYYITHPPLLPYHGLMMPVQNKAVSLCCEHRMRYFIDCKDAQSVQYVYVGCQQAFDCVYVGVLTCNISQIRYDTWSVSPYQC